MALEVALKAIAVTTPFKTVLIAQSLKATGFLLSTQDSALCYIFKVS